MSTLGIMTKNTNGRKRKTGNIKREAAGETIIHTVGLNMTFYLQKYKWRQSMPTWLASYLIHHMARNTLIMKIRCF
jgi:hypothetical protein